MLARARLKKGDITIAEVLQTSKEYYKKIDDKEWRAGLDIKSAKLTVRNNYTKDKSTGTWQQTGRNVKLVFLVKSKPVSYVARDNKVHQYPITILLMDVALGLATPFRARCGSTKMPLFPNKNMSKEAKEKVALINQRNGIEMGFFFENEWVLAQYNLLFGRNRTNRAPKITNPTYEVFFCKHLWFVIIKIIAPLLENGGKLLIGHVTKK